MPRSAPMTMTFPPFERAVRKLVLANVGAFFGIALFSWLVPGVTGVALDHLLLGAAPRLPRPDMEARHLLLPRAGPSRDPLQHADPVVLRLDPGGCIRQPLVHRSLLRLGYRRRAGRFDRLLYRDPPSQPGRRGWRCLCRLSSSAFWLRSRCASATSSSCSSSSSASAPNTWSPSTS